MNDILLQLDIDVYEVERADSLPERKASPQAEESCKFFLDRSRCLQLSLSVCPNQGWVNTVDHRSIHTKHA